MTFETQNVTWGGITRKRYIVNTPEKYMEYARQVSALQKDIDKGTFVKTKSDLFYISTKHAPDSGLETMVFKTKQKNIQSVDFDVEVYGRFYNTIAEAEAGHIDICNNLEKILEDLAEQEAAK